MHRFQKIFAELADVESLSEREREILLALGNGSTTRETAEKLRLSVATIETYRERIKKKLKLGSAMKLYRAAVLYWIREEIFRGER